METVVILFGGLGTFLFLSAVFFVKPEAPVASLNPKHWKPVWKQREYFRGPGYALQLLGAICMFISGLGILALWLL